MAVVSFRALRWRWSSWPRLVNGRLLWRIPCRRPGAVTRSSCEPRFLPAILGAAAWIGHTAWPRSSSRAA